MIKEKEREERKAMKKEKKRLQDLKLKMEAEAREAALTPAQKRDIARQERHAQIESKCLKVCEEIEAKARVKVSYSTDLSNESTQDESNDL
jgi:hypothetical protein